MRYPFGPRKSIQIGKKGITSLFFLNIPASAHRVEASVSEVLRPRPHFHFLFAQPCERKRVFSGPCNWGENGMGSEPTEEHSTLSQMYKSGATVHLRRMIYQWISVNITVFKSVAKLIRYLKTSFCKDLSEMFITWKKKDSTNILPESLEKCNLSAEGSSVIWCNGKSRDVATHTLSTSNKRSKTDIAPALLLWCPQFHTHKRLDTQKGSTSLPFTER